MPTGSLAQRTAIGWIWWDSEPVTTSATSQLALFQAQKSSSKPFGYTNMIAPGNFGDTEFAIHSIVIQPAVDAAFPDVQKLLKDAALQLQINNSTKLEAPLIALGGGGGIGGTLGTMTAAAGNAALTNGWPSASATWVAPEPIQVLPTELFTLVLYWPAAITISAQTRMYCILYGMQKRRAQL